MLSLIWSVFSCISSKYEFPPPICTSLYQPRSWVRMWDIGRASFFRWMPHSAFFPLVSVTSRRLREGTSCRWSSYVGSCDSAVLVGWAEAAVGAAGSGGGAAAFFILLGLHGLCSSLSGFQRGPFRKSLENWVCPSVALNWGQSVEQEICGAKRSFMLV